MTPTVTQEEVIPQVEVVRPQTTQEVTMNLSQDEETKEQGAQEEEEVVPEVPQTQVTWEPEKDEEVKVDEIEFDITEGTKVEEIKIEEESKEEPN